MKREIKNLDPNQVATLINNYKSFMDGKTLESKYKKNIGSKKKKKSKKKRYLKKSKKVKKVQLNNPFKY